MKRIFIALSAMFIVVASVAFTLPSAKKSVTKIYRYELNDDSHVFDGVSPYWVEVLPGNECDPIDPTLPCTVTIEIGEGGFANLDAFLDQFSNVADLMDESNVSGKDE